MAVFFAKTITPSPEVIIKSAEKCAPYIMGAANFLSQTVVAATINTYFKEETPPSTPNESIKKSI